MLAGQAATREEKETNGAQQLPRRVQRDLAHVIRLIRHSVRDVAAIVLTGGFAHGEGSFRRAPRGLVPLNDYDLLVIAKTEPDAVLLQRLGEKAARALGMRAVDLLGVGLHRFPWLPPTIFNYDLRYGGRVVLGDPKILDLLPAWTPRDIPLIEGQVLLLNRMLCLLECVEDDPARALDGDETAFFTTYQTAKAAFAVADVVLLRHGAYTVRYQDKLARLRTLQGCPPAAVELAELAWRFRQHPEVSRLPVSPALYWQRTRQLLLRTFAGLLDWMYTWHDSFGRPQEIAHFLANYTPGSRRRAAIAGAQYATLAAWHARAPDANVLATARALLTRAGIACPAADWPTVRRTVVEAWFRYCHQPEATGTQATCGV